MTLGEQVLEFEKEVSDESFVNEEKENILKLTTLEEVKDYYMDHRGWRDDNSFVDTLMCLLIDLTRRNSLIY
tara:strand:- start:125 stop:340 length:216 start_codon:yes stop_codon:yes gene_type:complete